MSQDELKVLKKFLKDNLKKGFIRLSSSSCASPILIPDHARDSESLILLAVELIHLLRYYLLDLRFDVLLVLKRL